jgi:hypothetical protein
MGTIVVGAIVLAVAAAAVRSVWKNAARGKCCGCDGCDRGKDDKPPG